MTLTLTQQFQVALVSCDERIASCQARIDRWGPYHMMMKLMMDTYDTQEDKDVFDNPKGMEQIANYENNMKLVKTEKLIYQALLNNKTNKAIFPLLLAKYDEYMIESYEMGEILTQKGISPEQEHIEFCKNSLTQRKYIKKCCDYGAKL